MAAPWSVLPEVPLLHISSFLSAKELASASRVCRSWHGVMLSDALWRPLCASQWLQTQMNEGASYYHTYIFHHRLYGRFKNYKAIKAAWQRIVAWLAQNAPAIRASLLPGATFEELARFESLLIPDHLLLLHLCNGQQQRADTRGVFGAYEFYDHRTNFTLCDLSFISDMRRVLPKLPGKWSKTAVPLASNARGGSLLLLSSGEVIWPIMGVTHAKMEAPSLVAFLEQYATDLYRGMFLPDPQLGISLWPALGRPEATTRGVRISVGVYGSFDLAYSKAVSAIFYAAYLLTRLSRYIPERSSAAEHLFSYHVSISMAADCQFPKAVLRTRHWDILDGPNPDSVDGPGVIGFYPEAYPGSYFTYCSCTTTHFPTGYMEGSFRFRDVTGFEFDAAVPRFNLVPPTSMMALK